jgi:hypothetical protein
MRARLSVDAIPAEIAGMFDAVVARCAGDQGAVIPIGLQLVRPGGVVIVSGPPRLRPLAVGRWVTVPGVRPDSDRRFSVAVRPADTAPSEGLPVGT